MCPVYDPQGRGVRLATAAGRVLVFRADAGGLRAFGCMGCTGIARRSATELSGGVDEDAVVAFLGRHPRPYIHIISAWDGPGRFPLHVPFMMEVIEGGVTAMEVYFRAPGSVEWMRVTLTLRRWPPPYRHLPEPPFS